MDSSIHPFNPFIADNDAELVKAARKRADDEAAAKAKQAESKPAGRRRAS